MEYNNEEAKILLLEDIMQWKKGLYATGQRVAVFRPFFVFLILPSSLPIPFPYHPVLWQGRSLSAYQP